MDTCESVKKILAVDNSGSTEDVELYWNKVKEIYESFKPDLVLFWNTNLTKAKTLCPYVSQGCTRPQAFITDLLQRKKEYDLVITTDGEIIDSDIIKSGELLQEQHLSLIKSTTIHYIGYEPDMNIGLNVIFGRLKRVTYQINDNLSQRIIDDVEEFTLDDIKSSNFEISLIIRIKDIKSHLSGDEQGVALAKLKGQISRLFSKLERDALSLNVDEQIRKYYEQNQAKEFLEIIRTDQNDVITLISRKKSTALNYFNTRQMDLNLFRLNAAQHISPQAIIPPQEESTEWQTLEDPITMEKFHLPGLLVQCSINPILYDNIIMKHPFKLLSQQILIANLMAFIEQTPIDYATFERINAIKPLRSPYTRSECTGIFVLDAHDMNVVRNNCRVISQFFGTEKQVPGNLVTWNLVFMYILCKHKFNGTEYEHLIRDEIKKFCKRFSVSIPFSHYCNIPRSAKIEISLWFCCQASPKECPNSEMNVLRSPFGNELYNFYTDIFGYSNDEMQLKVNKWTVWNYLVANKHKKDLKLEVKAQRQNYCTHDGHIILLGGACKQPFPSMCNILDPHYVYALFDGISTNSSKLDNIDSIQPVQHIEVGDFGDNAELDEIIQHVKINVKTCRPFVICPVTKLHWKECASDYSESYIIQFFKFCEKKKTYPQTYMDLVEFYSHRKGILTKVDFLRLEYVFDIFKNVMATYTHEKYVEIHKSFIDEGKRMQFE